jgi:ferric-dicitrate binding protein FerR (iron transport regulator)
MSGEGSDDDWSKRFLALTARFWRWLPASPGAAQTAADAGVLCTLVAAIALAFGLPSWPTSHLAPVRAAAGKVQPVPLPDGTRVLLGPGSWIEPVFDSRTRRVNLHGNAQFIVTHDPERPFQVCAGGILTQDVSTTFDVSAAPGFPIQTTVKEGSVRLVGECDSSGEPIRSRRMRDQFFMTLGPLEQMTVSNTGTGYSALKAVLTKPEIENLMAWSGGTIHCGEQEPLGVCVKLLNRLFFPKQLVVLDPSLLLLPVNIRFTLGRSSMESVLDSLEDRGIVRRTQGQNNTDAIELVSKHQGTTSVK